MKNECNKERTKENPYEIWVSHDGTWTWRILKKWQVDDDNFELINRSIASIQLDNIKGIPNFIGHSDTRAVLPIPKFKIGKRIVTSNSIFMMNSLKGKKLSTQIFFKNNPVFGFVFPITISERNQYQYIPFLSCGSTLFIIPSMSWDFKSAGLAKQTSFIFNPTTLTEVMSLFDKTRITSVTTPPAEIFATDFTDNGDTPFESVHTIYHYKRVYKPYARWFCAVKSPHTFGSFDIGDVYVKDIKANARKMTDEEMKEELKK